MGRPWQIRYPGRRSKGLPDVRPRDAAEAGWRQSNVEEAVMGSAVVSATGTLGEPGERIGQDPDPRQPLDPRDAGLLAEPGGPWVLLSLSTTQQGQAAALPRMLDAVAALPVRVLLTLGGALPPSAVDAPPNVTVRGFVPHEQLLPHMAAVIFHDGLSTITAALTAGVPLVCIPQGRDQPDNAQRVAAAVTLPPGRLLDSPARVHRRAQASSGRHRRWPASRYPVNRAAGQAPGAGWRHVS